VAEAFGSANASSITAKCLACTRRSGEAAHKTADHAPGLEAALDQDIWARDHGHAYDSGAYQLGESLPATLRSGS
jgi:hypothetical protein